MSHQNSLCTTLVTAPVPVAVAMLDKVYIWEFGLSVAFPHIELLNVAILDERQCGE
jgi:hypothetical protein